MPRPPTTDVRVERATASDREAVLALLAASGLTLEGAVEHLDSAIVARGTDGLVGCAALEPYTDGVLLRSVAVRADARGTGVGQAVTLAALELARTLGAPAVYLLTTTAERFFPRFGFEVIARPEVPPGVQHSVEFRSACPASATVMRRAIAS